MRSKRVPQSMLLGGVVLALVSLAASAGSQAAAGGHGGPSRDEPVVEAVRKVTRSTQWTLAQRLPLRFDTYHPQGFARVGDRLFLSSVEVIEAPVRYPKPVGGYDRSPGKGIGHVFVLDLKGNLLKDIVLKNGDMYHPGGIDTDGSSLWVPLAEYRPYSHSTVYRIDLDTLRAHEEFQVADHVGGLVRDPDRHRLYGVTWGSREFYTWDRRGGQLSHTVNSSHFVDYQDCAYAKRRQMLCTGVTNFTGADGGQFELGGIALLDLDSQRVRHEVPVQLWSSAGHVATRNPVHLEADKDGDNVRMWAAPDDGESPAGTEILVYEAKVG